jgi:3-mercaptopyruvate sulfurtransferase SseA
MKLIGVIIFIAFTALVSFAQGTEYKKFKDESEVPRIVLEDAKKAFDDKSAIFIDARAADVYKQEHIKGAISIPYDPSGTNLDKLPKGKRIIVYCS